MHHISDPYKTKWKNRGPDDEARLEATGYDSTLLKEFMESLVETRTAYCGRDLKDPENKWTLPYSVRHGKFTMAELCGDCLGTLDEIRREAGHGPLMDARLVSDCS